MLGDTKFLRTNYVGKLIDDEDEERRNIGYMGYWSGERYSIVKPEEAYSDSGEWRREQTLKWLVQDLRSQPTLKELNTHSVYTLLERKGQNILEDNPSLSRILVQTPHNVVDSDIDDDTAKYESRKIKGTIDDALEYYRKAKL